MLNPSTSPKNVNEGALAIDEDELQLVNAIHS